MTEAQHRIGEFMAYGNNDGLPPALFYSVYQSSDGYLWIGSSSGLVRFDGKRYKIYFSDYKDPNSISDNIIVDLIEDDAHNLWIAGFYQGISRYNLLTGEIKRYSQLSGDSTSAYGVNKFLKDDEGQIWAATSGGGLAHYIAELDSFEFFIPDPQRPFDGSDRQSNHIRDISSDPNEKEILWLACFDGLYSFDKRQKIFNLYMLPDKGDPSVPMYFLAVVADDNDMIWLGTWFNGIVSFDKKKKIFENYTYFGADPPNSDHYQVLDIKPINDTTLYLAARDFGLLSFNKKTQRITPLLTNEMLPDGSSSIDIQTISSTPNAGTFAGGNYYIYQQHKSFKRFSSALSFPYGPHFGVQQMIFDRHRKGYWMGSLNAGEIVFFSTDLAKRKTYKADRNIEFQCTDIAIDKNQQVWAVSAFDGLLELITDKNIFRRIQTSDSILDTIGSNVKSIDSDHLGNLWLLTRQSLYYHDVDKNSTREVRLSSGDNKVFLNHATLCAGKNNDVWVGSDRGLFHYSLTDNKFKHLEPEYKSNSGIANILIKSMTIDHFGNAWLGFESDGVQVVGWKEHAVISSYNLNDGLPGMQINYMTTDSSGRIWAGTSAGLALFDPKSPASVWQVFNREDGIKRDYIDRPIIATADGKLFYNIEEGLSWIDIGDDRNMIMDTPALHLTVLSIDGKPYVENILPDYISSLDLPYSAKEIRIEYAAMDWSHPERTKYFYRIDGITSAGEWIENSQANILLTGMKPGTYRFHLYAVSGNGIRSREIILPIIMHPPFWQRWWFVALVAVSLIMGGYAIYRYRINQIKKLQAMRNTISTNLHDDIGASLSNIHILTVLTQRNIANKENATSYITKAGDEIQRISESLSDIVWNINPKYDELDNLFIRMKRYAADMLDGKNIDGELIFPEAVHKISMSMDQRRDFYLIFKEAINNLTKYSQATSAIVRVTISQHNICLEVSDNGMGFNESEFLTGNGMQNMKQRAEKWKALLTVRSEREKGTRIHLEMKLN